ncbi:hypothetical protein BP6252_04301 [Coleophoma cylindrospora]|uniref:CT20-domain-containing protein n=1 Tax=Coleophoma cylindrospora TaxID=1849047 RepID=A0A3D8S034_9HELO|nr:hypothetical protein BP6252_04301 [Coleophoma cylindrospora]
MPPKRKSRGAPAVSTPATDDSAMAVDSPQPEESEKPAYDILKNPWTDEQETSLFKGIIKWKPAGMHKHFRMIALSEYLRNHGYDPRVDTHTRIPGIWEKLGTLYNMRVIDERENSFDIDEDLEEKYLEFKLPDEDFGQLMWEKGRAPPSVESSPPRFNSQMSRSPSLPAASTTTRKRKRGIDVAAKNRASTVTDTDEPRTSPTHSPTPKTTRSGRNVRSSGRTKVESSSRAQSKDTVMEDEEEGDAEEEEDGTQDGEEESTASPKPVKAASKGKPGAASKSKSTRKSGRKR